jgi:putative endonuclease
MLDCDGRRIYVGISTDVERRLQEHSAGGPRGARSTRGIRDLHLIYSAPVGSRALAQQVEYRLRKQSAARKRRLARQAPAATELVALLGLQALVD